MFRKLLYAGMLAAPLAAAPPIHFAGAVRAGQTFRKEIGFWRYNVPVCKTVTGKSCWLNRIGTALLALSAMAGGAAGQKFATLASFNEANGLGPYLEALVQGPDGNLYGTTEYGGTYGNGAIFNISPAGTLTTIYNFTGGADGANPATGVTLGPDGNFYGANFTGTIFKITPAGVLTPLGNIGGSPQATLVLGSNGNFYGTTLWGGAGGGTIYQVTPSGTVTTLHTFTSSSDGSEPNGLIQGANGYFYGTASEGGAHGAGTIYKITTGGTFTTLYSFTGGADGSAPYGALVQGANGNFYGTTIGGGASGAGTIFQITPAGALTSLYSFTAGADAGYPSAALIQATDGNLYGTTHLYGSGGWGTVFSYSLAGTFTTLYSFGDGADGGEPFGGLFQATDGNFYGTTYRGGTSGDGTVFILSMGLGQFVKTVPHTGRVGSSVLILGTNVTGTTSVTFNGRPAPFTVVSPTEITATVPEGATNGRVLVTQGGSSLSSPGPFLVTPSISSFSPADGPVGTAVIITGETFKGATAVAIGAVAASFTVNSYTQITATVPAGAKGGKISVTTPGGIAVSTGIFMVP
jgi:uncharacterized repeat protein (TIGR03803 family)